MTWQTVDPKWLKSLRARQEKKKRAGEKLGRTFYVKPKIPEPLKVKKEEQSRLLKAAKAKRQYAYDTAMSECKPFRRFVRTLARVEQEATSWYAGVLDIDVADVLVRCGMVDVAPAIKRLAIEEVYKVVWRLAKRDFGYRDEYIPWLLPKGLTFTVDDCKKVLDVY